MTADGDVLSISIPINETGVIPQAIHQNSIIRHGGLHVGIPILVSGRVDDLPL
jgi:hypothetical protein